MDIKRAAAGIASLPLVLGACSGSGEAEQKFGLACPSIDRADFSSETFTDVAKKPSKAMGEKAVSELCGLYKSSNIEALRPIVSMIEHDIVVLEPLPKGEVYDSFPFDVEPGKVGVYFASPDERYLGGLAGNTPENQTMASYFAGHNTMVIYTDSSNVVSIVEVVAHELSHTASDHYLEEKNGSNDSLPGLYDEPVAYDIGYRALWAYVGDEKMNPFLEECFEAMTTEVKTKRTSANLIKVLDTIITPHKAYELLGEDVVPQGSIENAQGVLMLLAYNMYLKSFGDDKLWYDEMLRVRQELSK